MVRLTTEFVRSVEMASTVPIARLDDVMDEVPLVDQLEVELESQLVPNQRVEKEEEEYETVVLERDEDPIDGEKEKKDPFGGALNIESAIEYQRQQQRLQQKQKQKERQQQWHELLHPKSQLQESLSPSTGFERLATVTRRIKIYEGLLADLTPTERGWISIAQERLDELRKEERDLYKSMAK